MRARRFFSALIIALTLSATFAIAQDAEEECPGIEKIDETLSIMEKIELLLARLTQPDPCTAGFGGGSDISGDTGNSGGIGDISTGGGLGGANGEGEGSGSGSGSDEGDGDGAGEGDGDGSGAGEGDGNGDGSGEGNGAGNGEGNGTGNGSGDGDGDGNGSGIGSTRGGSGYGDNNRVGDGSGNGDGDGSGNIVVVGGKVTTGAESTSDPVFQSTPTGGVQGDLLPEDLRGQGGDSRGRVESVATAGVQGDLPSGDSRGQGGDSRGRVESVATAGVQGDLPLENSHDQDRTTQTTAENSTGDPAANLPGQSTTQLDKTLPPDIPASVAANDDIIAAQFREAAEAETDPKVRAQLWNDYRRYKGLPLQPAPAGSNN